MRLGNKVAIVTGAGRGIGKAIALAFSAEGAKVVCAARTKKEIDDVAGQIEGLAVECDVAKEPDTRNLIDQTLGAYGQIDILVNNAGAATVGPVELLPVEDWDNVINVTLRGTFLCCKFALPSMIERKSGCIINISSLSARWGAPSASAYTAAKFAVNGFTESLSRENLARGIRVHVICPGPTVSRMRSEFAPTEDPGTLIQPEDIAAAALYLATQEHTAYCRELDVEPGQTIKYR
jgi:NAD(P)-dependent dehydrogenase (short-subunit alcohol dehydrogenase family)